MNIVEIAAEGDVSGVFARLQTLGRAWRPAEDVPWLVYLEAGTAEEISRIPRRPVVPDGTHGPARPPAARPDEGRCAAPADRPPAARPAPPERLCA